MKVFKGWRSIYKQKGKSSQTLGQNILFRQENGKGLTCRCFNKLLKEVLMKGVDYHGETICTHSLRQGMATEMARAGYSDKEVQMFGRWHSRAFVGYYKPGQAVRWNNTVGNAKNRLTERNPAVR